jgi:hypothetical protein
MNFVIRSLMVEDESIVWEMLQYAAHESSIESVRQQPSLARYALNWVLSAEIDSVEPTLRERN